MRVNFTFEVSDEERVAIGYGTKAPRDDVERWARRRLRAALDADVAYEKEFAARQSSPLVSQEGSTSAPASHEG